MANIILKTNSASYGTVTPSTTFYLGENQRRKIEAIPKSGYKFSHWSRSGNWAVLEDEGGEGDEQTLHTATVYVRSLTSSTEQNVTFTANFTAIPKQTLGTGTAPKINKSSSGTVRFGTTFTLTWNQITGANNYHEYTYLKGGTSALYNKSCGNTYSGTFGNWASSAIGNTYRYYIVPEDTTGAKLSPSITSCGYVDILIASQITLYQIDGTTPVSSWNGALITSWNKNSVNYSVSGRQPVKWYTGKNGTGTEVSSYSTADLRNLNKSVVLYAYASPIQYTISFNANGGTSVSPASASVNAGSAYQLSQITVVPAEGKKFKGWCENANGSGTLYTTSITPSKNTTLYAIYEDNYIISYDLNPVQLIGGGTLIPSPSTIASGQKNAGQDFAITMTIPTITGHTFSCWKDLAGTTYPAGGIYTKNSGTTLQAQWTPNTYMAVLGKPIPSGAPTATLSPTSWKFNTTITLPAAPTTGYDAEKWVPQENFWKITVGDTSTVVPGGGTYNFVSALTPTVQPQWTQITYWRGGALWIYVPEEGGFLD